MRNTSKRDKFPGYHGGRFRWVVVWLCGAPNLEFRINVASPAICRTSCAQFLSNEDHHRESSAINMQAYDDEPASYHVCAAAANGDTYQFFVCHLCLAYTEICRYGWRYTMYKLYLYPFACCAKVMALCVWLPLYMMVYVLYFDGVYIVYILYRQGSHLPAHEGT